MQSLPDEVAERIVEGVDCAQLAALARTDARYSSVAQRFRTPTCDDAAALYAQRWLMARYVAGAIVSACRRSLVVPDDELRRAGYAAHAAVSLLRGGA